jgi:AAA+ ATPase superfamily predicted ATPase
MNPFTFGNPIKEPAHFIGREVEIRQIVNRLLTSAHESTSIIGERRIGKTSLLNYLSNQEVAARLGLTPNQFCLIYVDFQGLTEITPQRFWQRVLKKMARSVCDESLLPAIQEISKLNQFDLFDLEDLFEVITGKGLTTVLFMDEFEYVTQNPNFKGDFFGGLRALAIHHGLALVPSTRRELADLCHSEEIKGSPFFNIFANVVLKPFSHTEVIEMLDGYTASGEFAFTSQEQDFIWKLGGGYPFFVQIAGHYVIEGKTQGLNEVALQKFAKTNFNLQADSHYSYLWNHCSESEKITLLIILTLRLQKVSKKNIPTQENLVRLRSRALQDLASLGKRGLVYEHESIYSIFSTSFEEWIRREILAVPGKQESEQSVEDWLKSSGQQDVIHAKGMLPGFKKKYWRIIGDVSKDLSINFAASAVFEIVRTLVIAGI